MNAEDLLHRYNFLKTQKATHDQLYQEIADFCLPNKADFNRTHSSGEERERHIIDQTAQHSIDVSSSSLIGLLANPTSRWFYIEALDEELNRDASVSEWFDMAGQTALNYINMPTSRFYSCLKESMENTLAFGMPAMSVQLDEEMSSLMFKSYSPASYVIAEDAKGMVDTVFIELKMTNRQVLQKEEWAVHSDIIDEARHKPDENCDIIFAVMPRKEGRQDSPLTKSKPIAGYYIDKKRSHVMQETGFDEMPIAVGRWATATNEVYGRGAASHAISDIKMINTAMRAFTLAIEKNISPVLFLPDESSLSKKSLTPGSINYYNASNGRLEVVTGTADLGISYQWIQDLKSNIRSMFYVDQLQLAGDANMTATEVLQRMDEKARLLAPAIGRISSEFLGPLIERSVNLLIRAGFIKDVPPQLQGAKYRVNYTTPITRAQRGAEAQNLIMSLTTMSQFLQISPESLDKIDMDKAMDEFMDITGTTAQLKRDDDEVGMLRQQRALAAQEQNALAQGQEAAGIAKTMSEINV